MISGDSAGSEARSELSRSGAVGPRVGDPWVRARLKILEDSYGVTSAELAESTRALATPSTIPVATVITWLALLGRFRESTRDVAGSELAPPPGIAGGLLHRKSRPSSRGLQTPGPG